MAKQKISRQTRQIGNVAKEPVFVKTDVVAAALGRTEESVRGLFANKQLPAKRIGGQWLMHRDDFQALIAPQGKVA